MIRWKAQNHSWEITCQHCSRNREKHGNYKSLVEWMTWNSCELCGKVFLSKEDAVASLIAAQMGNAGDGIAILWNILKEARAAREAAERTEP